VSLKTIPVTAGGGSYPVLVGPGASAELASVIPKAAKRAVVITQSKIGIEVESGLPQHVLTVPDGENSKTMANAEYLCRQFAELSLNRSDVVIAVGGGVVTDLAGFAASVFHRGTNYVNVATTLLAQVDASVGGKTGVNLPEGKNLVGSFWQPRAVICDTDLLRSLPPEEMRCGYGEVAKYAFIGAPGLESLPISEQVARCVELKAAVVAEDEHETSGRRAILNYGHTLAHALEAERLALTSSKLKHGEAVAIGLVFAARLAKSLGRIGDSRVSEHYRVVRSYHLGESIPVGANAARLVKFMAGDKKSMFSRSSTGLTFVLDGPNGVEVVDSVPEGDVISLLEEMISESS